MVCRVSIRCRQDGQSWEILTHIIWKYQYRIAKKLERVPIPSKSGKHFSLLCRPQACACMHAARWFAACKPGASDETGSPGNYSPTSLASSADRRPIYQSGRHSGHIRSSAHLFCSLPEIRGAATFVVTDQSIFSISGLSYVFLIGTLCPIGSQGYPPCHIPIDRNRR